MAKTYTITQTRSRTGQVMTSAGTIDELVSYYKNTLESGASYQSEKGNKKINCVPKTITGLISNLNNAVNNSASDGYAGITYALSTN